MTDLRLEPFRAEHLLQFTLPLDLPERSRLWRAAVEYERNGIAFTGWIGNEVLGCAGITILYPGVGEAWAIPSQLVQQYPVLFHRTVTRFLDDFVRFLNLRRIQTVIDAEIERNIRWAERLGFVCEGRMRAAGPRGQDMLLYARVI